MNILSKLDLIVFDLDKTICYPTKDFSDVFEDAFKFKIDAVSQAWIEKVTIDGICTGMEAVEAVLPIDLMNEKEKYFESISKKWAEAQCLFPGSIEFLKNLKIRFSGNILILTNGPSYSQHSVTEYLGLEKIVDKVYATGDPEIGIRKPSIECFKKIEKIYNANPDRCLFIGNSYKEDHLASIKAGWNSIWIKANKNEPEERDQLTIESFIEKMERKEMDCIDINWSQYT